MRPIFTLIQMLVLSVVLFACKKDKKSAECFADLQTVREIVNKKATVRMTGSAVEPVYLVEEGTIDTRLIPCNLSPDFYKDGLVVRISGLVKTTVRNTMAPCCAENFVIVKISR